MRSATAKKLGKDRDYLGYVSDYPCVICFLVWYRRGNPAHNWHLWLNEYIQTYGDSFMGRIIGQKSDTEPAHVGDRGYSIKCPDKEAIGLCGREHHRESKGAQHDAANTFFERFGVDRDELIARLNSAYETKMEAA